MTVTIQSLCSDDAPLRDCEYRPALVRCACRDCGGIVLTERYCTRCERVICAQCVADKKRTICVDCVMKVRP